MASESGTALKFAADIALVRALDLSGATLDQWTAFQRVMETLDDADYSPAFQDEYQRLWHEAAAARDELRDVLAALLDHAEAIQEHVPKSENWYTVRDAARRLVSP